MKLDMEMIGKLVPPGLLEVLGLVRLVQHLIAAIDTDAPSNAASLKTARLTARLSRQLRESQAYNLNLRIRMWVLQCAVRRAWVRDMIGERAIKRWHKRYSMLSKPGSGTSTGQIETPSRKPSAHTNRANHKYRWRQFALPRLAIRAFDPLWTCADNNAAYFGGQHINPTKLYAIPPQKPTVFWPRELCPSFQGDLQGDSQDNMYGEAIAAQVPSSKDTTPTRTESQKPKIDTIKISVRMKKQLTPRPPKVKIPPPLYQYFTSQTGAQTRAQKFAKKEQTQQVACAP